MTLTRINVKINPTEDPEKVVKAITNIFGDIPIKVDENEAISQLDGLEPLRTLRSRIASDRIRRTLNRVFTRWSRNNQLRFGLNRQAAYAGHVSVSLHNEDPLTPIQVSIEGNISELISFLTS